MILWLDFETTGLDPDKDHIIEGAVVLTDDAYKEIDSFHTPIRPGGGHWVTDREAEIRWAELIDLGTDDGTYVYEMHTKNGLIGELDAGAGMPLFTFTNIVTDLLRRHGISSSVKVEYAGSGVERFDVGWLIRQLPEVYEMLTYHAAHDMGTIRRTMRRWEAVEDLRGEIAHRAMPDVRRSIAECLHYHDYITSLTGGAQRRQTQNPMLVPVGYPCPQMNVGRCGCYGPHPTHVVPEPEMFTKLAEALRTGVVPEEPAARPWALLLSAEANLTGALAAEAPSPMRSKAEQSLRDLVEALAGLRENLPDEEPAPDAAD